MSIIIKEYTSCIPRTLEEANLRAAYLTKSCKLYITSTKINGKWYVTNRFDPRVEK